MTTQHVGHCADNDPVVIRGPSVSGPGIEQVRPSEGLQAPLQAPLAYPPVMPSQRGALLSPPGSADEVLLPRAPRVRGATWPQDQEVGELRAKVAFAEANPEQAPKIAAQLLTSAQIRLQDRGVATRPCVLAEGHAGLQIVPDATSDLGALAQFLDHEVDGFKLIYAPAKLFGDRTRGAVWGLHRQVVAAHDLVFEGQPDPITLHEVEHAVLNVGEEQGARNRWLGFMQSIDGSALSDVDEAQGGYLTYCSIQEIPAYAAQLRALARRLEACPEPGKDLQELGAMARWGRSLTGRLADVAQRCLQHLHAEPTHAIFDRRKLVPQDRDAEGTPAVLWLSVERPELRLSIPLVEPELAPSFEAMQIAQGDQWAAARAPLLAAARRELTDLEATSRDARLAFADIEAAVGQAEAKGDARSIRAAARLALKRACI